MSMEHPEKQKNAVKSVVDQVMDGIISQIIDGTLHPGDKLPTEMELCKQFGAGRNSVREAVKKLQAYGILYIKRADGTFVSENYNQKMLDPMLYSIILQKNSWQEFVELRSVIDIGTLNIIIQRNDITSFLPDLYRTFGDKHGLLVAAFDGPPLLGVPAYLWPIGWMHHCVRLCSVSVPPPLPAASLRSIAVGTFGRPMPRRTAPRPKIQDW